ncbi:MAG: hypothetical protein ACYC0V_00495 [Armatimonadota bacterium]
MNQVFLEPTLVCYDYDGHQSGDEDIYRIFHHLVSHLELLDEYGLKIGMTYEYYNAIQESFPWNQLSRYYDIHVIFQKYLERLLNDELPCCNDILSSYPDDIDVNTLNTSPDLGIAYGPKSIGISWLEMLWLIFMQKYPNLHDHVIATFPREKIADKKSVQITQLSQETIMLHSIDLIQNKSDWDYRCLCWMIQSIDERNIPRPPQRPHSHRVVSTVDSKPHHRPNGWKKVRDKLLSSVYILRITEIQSTTSTFLAVKLKDHIDNNHLQVLAPVDDRWALEWDVKTTAQTRAQNAWIAQSIKELIED